MLPGTSHSVCTAPEETSIFFSLPPASKATYRLSGDQNGKCRIPFRLVSEPARGLASTESKVRIHNRLTPSEPFATKTSRLPSGEIENEGELVIPGSCTSN